MLVKYELGLWKGCLEYKDEVNSSVYLQDINMTKNEEIEPKEFRTWLIIVETSYNSEHVLSNEEMKCKGRRGSCSSEGHTMYGLEAPWQVLCAIQAKRR